ncbi:MAG: hypothetical protein LBQ59_02200 [Candidatus Peribacteria bacterium]|nr:hypothetical protein [Candidatus Peribacteria bacterium]
MNNEIIIAEDISFCDFIIIFGLCHSRASCHTRLRGEARNEQGGVSRNLF